MNKQEEQRKQRAQFLDGVWDMVWRDDVKTLVIYSAGHRPEFILGEDAGNKFLDEINAHRAKNPSAYDRINPLETKDENGLFCYRTMRASARKTMNVQELARDDRYHEYGHLFLSEIAWAQQTANKGVYDTHKCLSLAIEKLGQTGAETQFMAETNVTDLQAIKGVLEDIMTAKKLLHRIDEKLINVLERWVP